MMNIFAGMFESYRICKKIPLLIYPTLSNNLSLPPSPSHKPQLNALQSMDVFWQRIKSIVDLGPPIASDWGDWGLNMRRMIKSIERPAAK